MLRIPRISKALAVDFNSAVAPPPPPAAASDIKEDEVKEEEEEPPKEEEDEVKDEVKDEQHEQQQQHKHVKLEPTSQHRAKAQAHWPVRRVEVKPEETSEEVIEKIG